MRSAVFLDRDDTLVAASKRGAKLLEDEDPRLLPGVAKGLSLLGDAGFLLVVVTNQPAIPLGRCTLDQCNSINCKINYLLEFEGSSFVSAFYCCDHPFDEVCDCRKPKPGLLYTAAKDMDIDLASSYMIGDERSDAEAGFAAGLRASLVVWPNYDQGLVCGSIKVRDFLLAAKTIENIRRYGNDKVPRDHTTPRRDHKADLRGDQGPHHRLG